MRTSWRSFWQLDIMLEPQGFMGHDDGFAFSLPQRESSYGVDCYGRVNLYLGIFAMVLPKF